MEAQFTVGAFAPCQYTYLQHPDGRTSLLVKGVIMNCCGLGELSGFRVASPYTPHPTTHKEKAEILAAFYRTYLSPGNFLYTLTDAQIRDKVWAHELFSECEGAVVMMGDPFPNLTHGPSMLQVFRVNVHKFLNSKYLDKYGQIKQEEVKHEQIPTPRKRPASKAVSRAVASKDAEPVVW